MNKQLIAKAILASAVILLIGMAVFMYFDTPKAKKEVISKTDLECLAENIYFEARNQSNLGQIAVAHVVLNRVKEPGYPSTICGVVKQAQTTSTGKVIKNKCQFSWFCDGSKDRIKNREEWGKSLKIALQAFHMYHVKDVTNGATFYHATYVKPSWSRKLIKVLRVDDHIFYKRYPI